MRDDIDGARVYAPPSEQAHRVKKKPPHSEPLPLPARRANGMVRMKDIAERGNVSLATVSRVLAGQNPERFSQETRDRIMKVAQELGWAPNRLVRGMQTGRTNTVGLMMVTYSQYWAQVLVGLHGKLLDQDILPLTLYPDMQGRGRSMTELEQLQRFMELRVDGIATRPLRDPAAIEYLIESCSTRIPVTTIEFAVPRASTIVTVTSPERNGMRLAIDHLVGLGHTRIGYVGVRREEAWAVDRRNAFVHEMAVRRLPVGFIEEIAANDRSALSQLGDDLRQATAVVVGHEELTSGVWHAASDAGLHFPRDLSIIGYGHFYNEYGLMPTFTRINQRPNVIGETVASLLTDPAARRAAVEAAAALGGMATPTIEVEQTLEIGETTGPLKS